MNSEEMFDRLLSTIDDLYGQIARKDRDLTELRNEAFAERERLTQQLRDNEREIARLRLLAFPAGAGEDPFRCP